MALRDDVFKRVGNAESVTAFEIPLHRPKFKIPTRADWIKVSPLRPKRNTKARIHNIEPTRPTFPSKWESALLDGPSPFAKLYRSAPIASLGEKRGNGSVEKRLAAVKSYVGSIGAYTATVARQSRESTKASRTPKSVMQWRWEITGKIERTDDNNAKEVLGEGTQLGKWQPLAVGDEPSGQEFRAQFYEVARAAIRTQIQLLPGTVSEWRDGRHGPGKDTSQIYSGDSDEAIFTPSLWQIRVERIDGKGEPRIYIFGRESEGSAEE